MRYGGQFDSCSRNRLGLGELVEILLQLLASTDPFAVDEHLGRRRHPVLGLKRVDLLAGGQQMLVDLVPRILEHPAGEQAVRTYMGWQLHAVEGRGTLGHLDLSALDVRCQCPRAGKVAWVAVGRAARYARPR